MASGAVAEDYGLQPCFASPRTAEAQLYNITTRVHRTRRYVPGLLRLLIQTAIHRAARGARPLGVADVSIGDPIVSDCHHHGDVAAQRRIRFMAKFRVAESSRTLF